MFIEHKFYVGLRDINKLQELKNTSLLSYLEDVGCMHSEIAGFGITTMKETRKTWVLLSWKIQVKKRPMYNDILTVKTWSRKIDKFYAFRDFEVYNQNKELVCIATSKWIFIDIDKSKLVRISEDVALKYQQELDYKVFEEEDLPKLILPESFSRKIDYKITKNMIDINEHLHNIYYMDIATEALPDNVSSQGELNNIEIMYKKEIKLGETIKALYSCSNNNHFITIKDFDENIVHAIIKLN